MKTTCALALTLMLAAPAAWSDETPCRYRCTNVLEVCLDACTEGAMECKDTCAHTAYECRGQCISAEEATATDVSPKDAQGIEKAGKTVMDAIDAEGSVVPKSELP